MSAPDLPITYGYRVASADKQAALGVGSHVDELDTTLPERLLTCGTYERAQDGEGWHVQWNGAITERWWHLDRGQVAQQLAIGRMREAWATPLTDDDLDAVTARLVALLEARAAYVPRPVSRQSEEAAIAGRVARARWARLDGAGVLRWGDRPADPVKTLGSAPELPVSLPTGGFLDRMLRRDPREHGEVVTAMSVEAWCTAHRGIVQPNERPDWAVVVDELRKLVTS